MQLRKTEIFREWLAHLRDHRARSFIVQRLTRIQDGLLGDCHSIGNNVSELRIHYGLDIEFIEMTIKTTVFDPAEYLETDEDIAVFMEQAFETGDYKHIAHCLGIAARAKGMTLIAKQTGLAREQLYKSFSEDGNPTLKNTLAVMKALGFGFTPTHLPVQRSL